MLFQRTKKLTIETYLTLYLKILFASSESFPVELSLITEEKSRGTQRPFSGKYLFGAL